ncbi:MAG: hypothetical protein K8R54_04945 [Bacteroidales bacterium]|nr:hypothetical protein [Bacteroidales bacterium]
MNEKNKITQFEKLGILSKISINKIEYRHISIPAKALFTTKCLNDLSEEYIKNKEIGGFIICEPIKDDTGLFLTFRKVHLVKNRSSTPHNSYSPYKTVKQKNEYENIIHLYIKQGFLPFRFHSHPIAASDSLQEKMNFLKQLDTSKRDQVTTLICENIEQINLRLPDILIVKESNSMFVGLYGGLICPHKFDKQKRKVISNVTTNISNSITEWTDTLGKKIGLTVGALVLIFLALKYPKISIPIAVTGTAVLPSVVYEHQSKPEYFAVTTGQKILIELPLIKKEEILINDKELQEIKINLDSKKTQ